MSTHGTDIYPVGLFLDVRERRSARRSAGFLYRRVRKHEWRAVRNYFNGYLAEHDGHHHSAGRGWTKRAAARRVERLCQQAINADLQALLDAYPDGAE